MRTITRGKPYPILHSWLRKMYRPFMNENWKNGMYASIWMPRISHSSSNGRKGSRLNCHRYYRRRNERSFRLHHCTNLIESFNKEIKRYVKRKEQFPNEDALERFLVTQFLDYNQKFGIRCHRGFDQAKSELLHMFENVKM